MLNCVEDVVEGCWVFCVPYSVSENGYVKRWSRLPYERVVVFLRFDSSLYVISKFRRFNK